jgi:organic hydroperoxide reductase OsmC/OhrA
MKAYEVTGYDATFIGEPTEDSMSGKVHEYASRLVWEGNKGDATSNYSTYGRQYRIRVDGKPDLVGSADKSFLGDPGKHDPEDLFLASLSSCHLLSYLALCAKHKISVTSYEDDASGTLSLTPEGGGKFTEVVLRPRVTIASGDQELAMKLHEKAHHLCFIANSVSCPVRNEPTVVRTGENG